MVQHLRHEKLRNLGKKGFKSDDETDDVKDNINEDFTFKDLDKGRLLEEYGKKKQRMDKIVTNN